MRKFVRLCVRGMLGLATLAVVGVLFLAWRLDQYPLALDRLKPHAEAQLSAVSGSAEVDIGSLLLAREGAKFVLRAEDIRAVGPDGNLLSDIPTAIIHVSIEALVKEGVLAPEQVILEGINLRATIEDGGRVLLGTKTRSTEPGVPATEPDQPEIDITELMALWQRDPRMRYLRRVGFEYASLSVSEPNRGHAWRAPNISATFERKPDGVVFHGKGRMRQQLLRWEEIDRDLGTVGWAVQAHQGSTVEGAAPEISAELTLDEVDPSILSGIIPPLVGERGLEAPISGTMTSSFPADLGPQVVTFSLELGEGQITVSDEGELSFERVSLIGKVSLQDASVHLDQLSLHYADAEERRPLRLSGDGAQLADGDIAVTADVSGVAPAWLASISPAFSRLGGVDAVLSGDAGLLFDASGELRNGNLRLHADRSTITLPDLFEGPLVLGGIRSEVALRNYGAEWTLDTLALDFPDGATVRVEGSARRGPAGGKAELTVSGSDFQLATVKRFWPLPVSPPAREWVVENVSGGTVPTLDAVITADIGGVGEPLVLSNVAVDSRMPLRNVSMTYWKPLPEATGIDAEARITEKLFEARILTGETGGMTGTGGLLRVTGIDKGKGHEVLELDLEASGPAASLMAILDREPLGFAGYLGLKPEVMKGQVSGVLRLVMPPIAELGLDDIEITAKGRSVDAFLPGIVGGSDLDRANLAFDVGKTDLRLDGNARVEGEPVKLSVHMPFGGESRYRGRYTLIGRLDNAARRRVGLDGAAFQPPFIDGSTGFIFTATEGNDGRTWLDAELDLTKAALSVAPVGWQKPKGSYAAGKVRMVSENGVLRSVESFQVAGPGLKIAGNARWTGEKGRPTIRFSALKLGGGTDLQATIRPLPTEGYEIELGQGRLDLRPVILANTGSDARVKPGGGKTLLLIKASGLSVRVRDGPPFHDMRGSLLLQGERVLNANFSARPDGGKPAEFILAADGGLSVNAGDAGAFMRTMGMPGRIEGGVLKLTGTAASDLSDIDAKLDVRDFRMVEAPVMMRVLQHASITGPLELLAGSEGLEMTALEAPFTLKDKKLTIREGRVYGGSLGVTFRGGVDIPSQVVDMSGAVVPVYVLNRLLSAVPLVGDVLTGGEGVFAVSYSVSGRYTNPKVEVHPLSVLAPGGLRRLLLD